MNKSKMRVLISIAFLLMFAGTAISDPLPEEFFIAQGEEDIRIRGENEMDRLGQTITVQGDVNGDGYPDLLAGAPQAEGSVGSAAGKTYVFFGSLSFPDTIDLSISSADLTIAGMVASEWSGYSLASGDLNGDGFDDIVIGAYYSTNPNGYHAGRVYIVFGGENISPYIDLAVDSADVIIAGGGSDYRLGCTVAVGEINGDNIDDLMIGASHADTEGALNGGEVYVFLGDENWQSRIDLAVEAANITIQAGASEDHLGTAMAVGDVNGDAYDDMMIGAPDADPNNRLNAGSAYIVFGGTTFSDTVDLSQDNADIQFIGGSMGIRLGSSVVIGDFDFRGFGEIIFNAPYANTINGANSGEIYLFVGNSTISGIIDLRDTDPEITIIGADANDNAGSALSIGDVNGDGYWDLLIGAPNADVGSETEAGISYLIYGSGITPPITIDLATGGADVTIYGTVDNDFVGKAVGIADINGDGFGDLLVGASGADPPGGSGAGETYAIFGDGDDPVFESVRRLPSGNQPKVRFRPQNAWVKFINGTLGVLHVARTPSRPLYTSPHAAQVWWEISTTKIGTSDIQLTFRYTDEQIYGLEESSLRIWKRSQTNEAFVQLPNQSVDPPTNRISITVDNLGQFAISDQWHPLGVVEEENPSVVGSYCFHPATPNPFNSSVLLRYDLPAEGHVTLAIYNIMGQKVAAVVDQDQILGSYRVHWNPGDAATGIYFAVMQVHGFEAVQKLLLLR